MSVNESQDKNKSTMGERLQTEVDSIMKSASSGIIYVDEEEDFVDILDHDRKIEEYSLSPRITTYSHYKIPKKTTGGIKKHKIVVKVLGIGKTAGKKIARKINYVTYVLFRKYEF